MARRPTLSPTEAGMSVTTGEGFHRVGDGTAIRCNSGDDGTVLAARALQPKFAVMGLHIHFVAVVGKLHALRHHARAPRHDWAI